MLQKMWTIGKSLSSEENERNRCVGIHLIMVGIGTFQHVMEVLASTTFWILQYYPVIIFYILFTTFQCFGARMKEFSQEKVTVPLSCTFPGWCICDCEGSACGAIGPRNAEDRYGQREQNLEEQSFPSSPVSRSGFLSYRPDRARNRMKPDCGTRKHSQSLLG